jgi:hypothetical protein
LETHKVLFATVVEIPHFAVPELHSAIAMGATAGGYNFRSCGSTRDYDGFAAHRSQIALAI